MEKNKLGIGIHNCKECYMVTEINGEYECDCILYGKCPLDEKQENHGVDAYEKSCRKTS